jgi:hypothetical protein
MTTHDFEGPPEDLSPEELKDAFQAGEITVQEVRENETLRRRLRHLVVKRDIEEHRDIYDRLAEV